MASRAVTRPAAWSGVSFKPFAEGAHQQVPICMEAGQRDPQSLVEFRKFDRGISVNGSVSVLLLERMVGRNQHVARGPLAPEVVELGHVKDGTVSHFVPTVCKALKHIAQAIKFPL